MIKPQNYCTFEVQIKHMNPVFSKHSFQNNLSCAVINELEKLKTSRKEEDWIILEARNLLRQNALKSKLNLDTNDFFEKNTLDENETGYEHVYTIDDIKTIAILYRLCFMDINYFKKNIPTVAEVKLEYLNQQYEKNITGLKILSYRENFSTPSYPKNYGLLFAPTKNGNYYLIHQWGAPISQSRKWKYLPLRSFETLAISIALFTLIVDLILPTRLITLDHHATYWSGYRLGVYFHLLIFFGGLSMFIVLGFFKNISKNIWNTA